MAKNPSNSKKDRSTKKSSVMLSPEYSKKFIKDVQMEVSPIKKGMIKTGKPTRVK